MAFNGWHYRHRHAHRALLIVAVVSLGVGSTKVEQFSEELILRTIADRHLEVVATFFEFLFALALFIRFPWL